MPSFAASSSNQLKGATRRLRGAGYGGLLMGPGGISPIPIAGRLAAAARSRCSTNAGSGIRRAQRQDDLGEVREWRRSRILVFSNCARMRARPAGPDQSSVFHNFARRGPTKEAHRRALNRPDGLLRSVAGRGHGRFLPVTPPRERPDQGKRPTARFPSYTGGLGTHQGRDTGTHQGRDRGSAPGTDPGGQQPNQTIRESVLSRWRGIAIGNYARRGRSGGLDRPRRGRDPAPSRVRPMPSPDGNTAPARAAKKSA